MVWLNSLMLVPVTWVPLAIITEARNRGFQRSGEDPFVYLHECLDKYTGDPQSFWECYVSRNTACLDWKNWNKTKWREAVRLLRFYKQAGKTIQLQTHTSFQERRDHGEGRALGLEGRITSTDAEPSSHKGLIPSLET